MNHGEWIMLFLVNRRCEFG